MTLDDDVATKLREAARRTGRPFRTVVNDALRAGLDPRNQVAAAPFLVVPADLGLRPGIDLDSISELLELVDGPEHR